MIDGDSAIGKTLVRKRIECLMSMDKAYSDIKVISVDRLYQDTEFNVLEYIKKLKNNCIIIDNADVLLDNKTREYIGYDINNQYIIMGRCNNSLAVTPNQIATLIREGNTLKLDYYIGLQTN